MDSKISWTVVSSYLLVYFLFFLVIGFETDSPFACLFLGMFLLVIWHCYHIIRLAHWVHSINTIKNKIPFTIGLWRFIFQQIQEKKEKHLKERVNIINQFNEYQNAIDSLPDAILICDKKQKLEWCNKHAVALLELKWPEDTGQLITSLIRSPQFNHYLEQASFLNPLVFELRHNIFLEFRIQYQNINQKYLFFIRDISNKYFLEKSRETFFANVSHELRIPLTVLQGYIELLSSESNVSKSGQKAYNSMQNQIDRLISMVNQLMTLSRIEGTPIDNKIVLVDIPDIIYTIYDEVSIRNKKKHNIHLFVDTELSIYGNEQQLKEVITNLIYNGIEHNEKNCNINIHWKKIVQGRKEYAQFSIIDDGIGIEKEHIYRLTERFYRVNSARTRDNGGGSGLGLAIVKHALLKHDSDLYISSEIGKGSSFQFNIPILNKN